MIGPLTLDTEAATAQLAQDIAMVAEAGWTIRLEGDLGAGKSTFARAFIRTLADDLDYEVPSPTYTLVQHYEDVTPPVVHADLYRLSDPSQVIELGLEDDSLPAIYLVEWPENAGEDALADALTIRFDIVDETARSVRFGGPTALVERVARTVGIRVFLDDVASLGADRRRLQGDASTRRYERIGGAKMILMDAPRQADGPAVKEGKPYSKLVHLAESVHAFVAVGAALREHGFAAPALHGQDLDAGLLLLEDLGHGSIVDDQGKPMADRYEVCTRLLARLHAIEWPHDLPVQSGQTHHLHRYSRDVMLTEIELCPQWYAPYRSVKWTDMDRSAFFRIWADLLSEIDAQTTTLTLRDYHSPNLIWRSKTVEPGLIDHQDALRGPPAYDLASLVQDARVTIKPSLQRQLIEAYCDACGASFADIQAQVALMGAQRNTKILGIFARLNARDGKSGYLHNLPRVESYMRQNLTHPLLASLRPFYADLLPETP